MLNRLKKIFTPILMSLLLLTMLTGCNSDKTVIAEVNGEKLTDEQLKVAAFFLFPQAGKDLPPEIAKEINEQAFSYLITITLAAQESAKVQKNPPVSAEQELQWFRQQLQMSPEAFKDFLDKNQLDEKAFADMVVKQKLALELMTAKTSDAKVTTEEAKAYFDAHPEKFKSGAGIQISHILVETEAEATELIAKIKSGTDFAELAKKFSICSSSAKGGDLGLCNESTNFVTEFKMAALALNPGEMTDKPVKSEFGYHIIKAGEKTDGQIITFAEIETELIQQLTLEKQQQIFADYIEKEVKANAEIKDLRFQTK